MYLWLNNTWVFKIAAIVLLFCLLIPISEALGQEKVFSYHKFTQEDGLGLKYHYCTTQDRDGFIWLGTGDGLYRYDGHGFKKYSSPIDKEKRSISSILVSVVYDSVYNRLWLASVSDLQYFDLNDYTFHPWLDSKIPQLTQKVFSKRIFKADDHTIWLSSGKELYAYDIKTGKFSSILHQLQLPKKVDNNIIKLFPYGRDHVIVMFTNYLLLIHKNNFSRQEIIAEDDEYFLFATADERRGEIYVGANKYLLVYNVKKREKERYSLTYYTKNKTQLFQIIASIVNYDKHYLFIPGATKSLMFDKINKVLTPVLTTENKAAIGINTVYSFKDREGNIWLNSFDNYSMVIYNSNHHLISTTWIQNEKGIFIEPYSTYRYSKDLYLFCGSGMTGIGTLDPHTARITLLDNPAQKYPIVSACIVFPDGKIFNADKDHINLVDIKNKRFTPVSFNIGGVRQKLSNINHLVHLGNKKMMAISDHDVFLLNIESQMGTHKPIKDCFDSLEYSDEPSLTPLGEFNNRHYFKTDEGVFWLDTNLLKFLPVHFPKASNTGKSIGSVSSMDVDKQGNIWLSSEVNGVFKIDARMKQAYQYYDGNSIMRITYANKVNCLPNGQIWVSSGDIIYVFDSRSNEWQFEYSSKTGMPGLGYSTIYFPEDNKMVFNYYPYINILTLDSVLPVQRQPSLKITSFMINGEEKLSVPTESNLAFKLNYQENDIDISFANLSFVHSFNNRYRYKLVGLDTTWTTTYSNKISYKRLPSGDYTLLLKASDASGRWGEVIRKVEIRISPVFYSTIWFQMSILSVLALLGYFYYRHRINRVRITESLKSKYNKELSKLELKALRAQMNPHFIFNSLNSIQKFIFDKDEYAASQYLTKFSRLIRYILEHSNLDYVTIREEMEMLRYYLELELLRFDKQFTYKFEISEKVDEGWLIPTMIIQPHVENAIWHGLMHKEGNGHMLVSFNLNPQGKLLINIEDNGIGREMASELKSKQLYKKRSFGSSLSQQKLKTLAQLHNIEYDFSIVDLKDIENKSMGTRVEITISVMTNENMGHFKINE